MGCYLVSKRKLGFFLKIKEDDPALAGLTTVILIVFRGLKFESDAETCPPLADWTKRPFMDGHYLKARVILLIPGSKSLPLEK